MTSLGTLHVDDWEKFIEENDIDLACPTCHGEGIVGQDDCEDCGGAGYLEPMWNTIWNTGFHGCAEHLPAESHGVIAFEYDNHVWFALAGCGMDMTPHLAAAWAELFPQCEWIPEQFCVEGLDLREGYVESCVGKEMARRIYKLMDGTIEGMRNYAERLAEDLKLARKRLAKK